MYAEHRYAPRQSRTVSLGAALLINGALIAGLIYSAPNVISKKHGGITVIDIFDPPEPPPLDPPKPQPKAETATPAQPRPSAPEPTIRTDSPNTTATSTDVTPPLPPLPPVPKAGPTAVVDPLPPLPLVSAEQDPRFARDFQPGYPAAELRAQRDGIVKLRVLIGIDGRVKAAEPVTATSDAFFDATRRQALSKWRFKPATRGGVPQESWKTMTVRFRIEDQ